MLELRWDEDENVRQASKAVLEITGSVLKVVASAYSRKYSPASEPAWSWINSELRQLPRKQAHRSPTLASE